MPFPSDPVRPGFPRRTMLAASAAGLALLAAGCTPGATEERDEQSGRQADALTGQVVVQQALVAAYAAAAAADPTLGTDVTDLAAQAREQLDRLRAAAPTRSSPATSSAPGTPGPPAGPATRAWLREQVAAAASSHAGACLEETGARAALVGSITAGLRGHETRLASG